ncbi:MAG: alpha/beta fold hydrolase [Chlamydiota bacterium]
MSSVIFIPFAIIAPSTTPKANHRPILLVHGYMHHRGAWLWMHNYLKKKGLGPIYTLNLMPPLQSIEDHATLVKAKAAEIEVECGIPELIIVGHSMGGLVGAYYAENLAPPGKISHLITLSSPLQGTYTAKIAPGKNAREMIYKSKFTQELSAAIAKNSQGIKYFHIATKHDRAVIPWESELTGQNPANEYIIEDLGHVGILFSSRVGNKIVEWLSR